MRPHPKLPARRHAAVPLIAALVCPFPAFAANPDYAYLDSLAPGWSDWSWGTTYTNDTVVKKSGTASARVDIVDAWAGFSLSETPATTHLSDLSAVSFDINPGAAGNIPKVAALVFSLQNGATPGAPVAVGPYASPALAANTWSTVSVPISTLAGKLTAMNRLNLQDGLGQGGVVFNVDNIALVPAIAATPGCAALAVDSGINNAGISLNGYLNDRYIWHDSACKPRSVALARNDTSKGGNAKQFTYTLPNGTTRTVNPGAGNAGGFGYVVAHLSNPSFANSYGKDDSPLGSGNSATYQKLFAGRHHALHEYTLNYVRYGLTQAALDNHAIDPWTWIKGATDPNRQYVTAYNMPVRIQWLFATGRDYPVWTVTFDLSQAPNHAIDSDFRAPYGDMKVEGGNGTDNVGGVGWGDRYKFVSKGNPFTMNNDWDYSKVNPGAPYDFLWTSTVDAEMGLAGTQVMALQNAGGYNNYLAPVWRGKTSTTMGQICQNDQGAGPGYNHKLPCDSDWAYQLIQYSLSNASEVTSDKRLAWGADWGSLGNSSFVSSNGYTVSGWPKVSYSVHIVLNPHSKNPTQNIALQAKTARLTALTATVGSVRTQGIAGIGRSDLKTYTPAGYSPVYGTWEVNAANNNLALSFAVASTAPSTLNNPILVVHGYTGPATPAQVLLDGVPLVADSDVFISARPASSELWITLNRKLAGTHSFQLVN
ncbi:hypothetical protein SAMN02949497_1524 [Methylomagnum ishizawai]|uniref:Uncharacterized protein n=1 Tax=Methylomagnum ishizawai TaxID=1760988 RepID=A0A1Y6D2K1_9GAMM|nr:hypothetical protein [Methylomagnum ishizawai]SMF94215.1 hypothetical protein SAMN02949497_1524 [Methylomagnum ishizawai]